MIYLLNTSLDSVTLYEIEIRNWSSVVEVETKDEDYIWRKWRKAATDISYFVETHFFLLFDNRKIGKFVFLAIFKIRYALSGRLLESYWNEQTTMHTPLLLAKPAITFDSPTSVTVHNFLRNDP